jgi:transcriptional regulator with XRE-family HTH domain
MFKNTASHEIEKSCTTFGALLRHLRRRAGLTQHDLGVAVGYSTAHICLLENGQRRPDLSAVDALFVPALDLSDTPDLATRLLLLASAARGSHIQPTSTERGGRK